MPTTLSAAANIDSIRLQEQAAAPSTPASGYGSLYLKDDGHLHLKNDGGADYPITYTPELFVPATDMTPTTTAGSAAIAQSETATNKVNYRSLDFDQTTKEYANFPMMMPDDWNAGTVTFKAVWTAAAGTGDVIWGLQAVSFANDDALDTAWGTAQTSTDTLLATGDVHVSPVSSAITIANTPAAGELVIFQIYRDAAAGGDTLNADAKLIGIKLYYTRA